MTRHTLGRQRTALALRLRHASPDDPRWDHLLTLMACLISPIAKRHLPLVHGAGDLDDLRQAGRMGVMDAVATFDRRRGVAFATHAGYWVRKAIQDCAAGGGTFRVPPRLRLSVWRGKTASGYSDECHLAAMAVAKAAVTPDLLEGVSKRAEREDLADDLADLPRLLRILDGRESIVVRRRFGLDGDPQTLRAIGQGLGLTSERVRQIERAALAKLREHAEGA